MTPSDQTLKAIVDGLLARNGQWKKIQGINQIEFRCFVHEDRTPSAQYHPAKMVWICRTCGNNASGGIRDLCRRLNLEYVDRDDERVAKRPAHQPGQKPVATYLYKHAGVTYTKARYEFPDQLTEEGKPKKDFRWSPRFPEGVSVADMPLFWREDPALVSLSEPIVFVEGEKVVEACWQRQLHACCGPWGASQRTFGAGLDVLKGRTVWLAPDNDEAGRSYMDAISSDLRKLGVKVRWIRVPLPHKGDLADFFAAGGDIEAIWKGDLEEPAVEFDSQKVTVRMPSAAGNIAFEASDIRHSERALDARLRVSMAGPGADGRVYSTRMNLLSSSARRDARTELAMFWRQLGKEFPWSEMLNEAGSMIEHAYASIDVSCDVFDVDDTSHETLLLGDLLPKGQPAVIFGDSGSLKTYFALLLAIAVATGCEFPGEAGFPTEFGAVLYLDFEDVTAPTFKRRLRRLHAGMGIDMLPGLFHYWPGRGIPLVNQVDALREKVRRDNIRLLIIDSAVPACDGPAENSDVASRYFGALTQIGVSSITIAHTSNEQDVTRPFGSRFWRHLSRRLWYIQKAGQGNDYETGLYGRKVNEGAEPEPKAYRWHFEGRDGPISFSHAAFREVDRTLNRLRPVDHRLREALSAGPMSVGGIAHECGIGKWEAVRDALNRFNGQFMRISGEGQEALWALRARETG